MKLCSGLLLLYATFLTADSSVKTFTFDQTVNEKYVCPEGWMDFNGSCYKRLTGETYRDSYRFICQEEGGDLASVHSSEENEFLVSLLRDNPKAVFTWIGGYDCTMDGHCKWLDGSEWDWDNWYPGKDIICQDYNYYFNHV